MNSDAKHLRINQTKPFVGCIDIALLDRGMIIPDEDHFMRHYINSKTQRRLSLECLNTVRATYNYYCMEYSVFISNMYIQQALMAVEG